MHDDTRHNALRERLTAGDPAGAEAPLTRDEVLELWRQTLAAVPTPRRNWLPVLVPIACGLLAITVGAALWLNRQAPEPASPAPRVAEVGPGPSSPEGRNGGSTRP